MAKCIEKLRQELGRFRFTIALLVIYTYIDIIVSKAWPYLNITKDNYFFAWEEVLVFLIIIQVIRFRHERPITIFLMSIALLLLARNGAEDFLFYALSGQLPPTDLSTWLTGQLIFPRPASDLSTYFGVLWGMAFLSFASSKLPYSIQDGLTLMVKKVH